MTQLRAYISCALIAILTLTGHSMAIARGAPLPVGFVELCTGSGPVIVAIDEEGEPTGASHICPDFSLLLQDMLVQTTAIAAPVGVSRKLSVRAVCIDLAAYATLSPSARGPPDSV